MANKKFSDTDLQNITDDTKILAEDNSTTDKFAHITGSKLLDYLINVAPIPEYTQTQINGLSPELGQLVKNTTESRIEIYDGSDWIYLDNDYNNLPVNSNSFNTISPTPTKGKILYDTDVSKLKIADGSNWIEITQKSLLFGNNFLKVDASNFKINTDLICRSSDDAYTITVDADWSKDVTSTFAEGSGNGAVRGSITANRDYYIYAISKSDGTSDIMITLKNSIISYPSGFSYGRQIGILHLDKDGDISNIHKIASNNLTKKPDLSYNIFEGFEMSITTLGGYISIGEGITRDNDNKIPFYFPGMEKNPDNEFVAGHQNGMKETGLSISANTNYYIYLILDNDTGAYDAYLTDDATPSLPSGYDYYVLIGYYYEDSSGNKYAYNINTKKTSVNFDIINNTNFSDGNSPTYEKLFSGDNDLYLATFDGTNDIFLGGSITVPYGVKSDTPIKITGSFVPERANSNGDAIYTYLKYIISKNGSTNLASSHTLLRDTITIPDNGGEEEEINFGVINSSDIEAGAKVIFVIGRDATNGDDDYSRKIAILNLSFEFLQEKKGSDTY